MTRRIAHADDSPVSCVYHIAEVNLTATAALVDITHMYRFSSYDNPCMHAYHDSSRPWESWVRVPASDLLLHTYTYIYVYVNVYIVHKDIWCFICTCTHHDGSSPWESRVRVPPSDAFLKHMLPVHSTVFIFVVYQGTRTKAHFHTSHQWLELGAFYHVMETRSSAWW